MLLCPSMSKSWEDMSTDPLKLGPCIAEDLPSFRIPKICEDKEVIIRYMKQEFRIVDHLFKRLPEDFQQLSRRCSMQVSGISHSWALDSGLVGGFRKHPVAVYLKCRFAFFVILFGKNLLYCNYLLYLGLYNAQEVLTDNSSWWRLRWKWIWWAQSNNAWGWRRAW